MYVLFLIVGLLFAAIYLLFFMREVPGAASERFGELEAVPSDAHRWKVDTESPEAEAAAKLGLTRESRIIIEDSNATGNGAMVCQVRYRGAKSGVIERVDPDVKVKRRRVFARE